MCFFPIKCLKFITTIGGIIFIAAGILLIVAGSIVKKNLSGTFTTVIQPAFLGFLISGIILILFGVLGIFAGLKRIKCLILIFSIVIFIFFLIFLAFTVASKLGSKYVN